MKIILIALSLACTNLSMAKTSLKNKKRETKVDTSLRQEMNQI